MCLKYGLQKPVTVSLNYCFRGNLTIVKLLGDRAAQGRACGNLGNTHYLLGNFDLAIMFHEEVRTSLNPFLNVTSDYLCWFE